MISGLITYKMWKEVTPKGAGLARLTEPSQWEEFLKTKIRHHNSQWSASLSAHSSDHRRNPETLIRNLNMAVYGEMILWSFVFLLAGKTEMMFLFLWMTDLWSCAFTHCCSVCCFQIYQHIKSESRRLKWFESRRLNDDVKQADIITQGGLTIVSKSSKLLEGKRKEKPF